MKIDCVGGGPASLYLAVLAKLREPAHEVTVHERHAEGTSYGWGVTYWPDLLADLHAHDPESARLIEEQSVCWRGGFAYVGDRTTAHDGDPGHAIGRHRLRTILADRARYLGVRLEFGREIGGRADLPDADLVVAGDGAHSGLRTEHAAEFGTRVTTGANRFIWLGTTRVFTAFTFAFVETGHGWIWCYAYGFSDEHSTCVVECSATTWSALGFDRLGHAEALRLLEELFSDLLEGHELLGRKDIESHAQWQAFPTVTNAAWSHGNLALIGDAAHTTHYSIGAGTTLALRDAMSLARAVGSVAGPRELPAALAAYEQERRRALLPVQSAARHSAQWYENLPRYMALAPHQMFALLGQRHSPLLPYVPPQLYFHVDQALGRLQPLRRLKQSLGPRLARTLQSRRTPGR
ncbi:MULTISPECIES: FAD-dependent monooxygenase [unclassified Streptomyces]|uniref:FAD-dependent monooxygenase n=1 Tax=unclassified Streptomyces TaxID=2593676 RepID=UPI00136EDE18|nr:FAD-binding monooxygenase [Streptomyces sp. SID335]MYZ17574.1 FAD-binding monooxygenase [Streptomyces sp. SID337]NDZ84342.1 FAD-binding monooxygenase [Streptomyces sp. SID10115]NEA02757.1 FAD-binding monooxygenase [Streptomyces sp. SID10116]NEB47369.1 FAD-binding monooxygenase [Streptomyces sp. SID339]